MRTEYTVRIIDSKGKITDLVYPKKYAFEKAEYYKQFDNNQVELYKVQYNGSTFYKAEKII